MMYVEKKKEAASLEGGRWMDGERRERGFG